MSLGGEKNQLKEWEGGVGKGKGQGEKVSTRFYLGRPERCWATREKRRGLEGSRETMEMELIMQVGRRGDSDEGARGSPASVRDVGS